MYLHIQYYNRIHRFQVGVAKFIRVFLNRSFHIFHPPHLDGVHPFGQALRRQHTNLGIGHGHGRCHEALEEAGAQVTQTFLTTTIDQVHEALPWGIRGRIEFSTFFLGQLRIVTTVFPTEKWENRQKHTQ